MLLQQALQKCWREMLWVLNVVELMEGKRWRSVQWNHSVLVISKPLWLRGFDCNLFNNCSYCIFRSVTYYILCYFLSNSVTNVERGHCAPSYFSAPPLKTSSQIATELRTWQSSCHLRHDDRRRGTYHHRGKKKGWRAARLPLFHRTWWMALPASFHL